MHCIEYKNNDLNTLKIPPKPTRTLTLSVLGAESCKTTKKNIFAMHFERIFTPPCLLFTPRYTHSHSMSVVKYVYNISRFSII